MTENSFDAESIVTALYRTLLLREPEEAGLQSHVAFLNSGGSVQELLHAFVTSPEFSTNFQKFQCKYLDDSGKRLVLDRSQFGEVDLLIRQIINDAAKHRIVVDVGARGKENSNSYDLLRSCGWKGLLIEANPALISTIEADFSGLDVTVVHCAVSDFEGTGTFHIGVSDDVSSLTEANAQAWGATRGTVEVPIRRLGEILKDHKIPDDFDLLSLDLEGEDIRVINDLIQTTNYRPQWVIIEASWGSGRKSFETLALTDAVRRLYSMADQTEANLILRLEEPHHSKVNHVLHLDR